MRKFLHKISSRKGPKVALSQPVQPVKPSQKTPLCGSCGDVIQNRYFHNPRKCTYADLKITAVRGCDTCSVIAEGIDTYLKELSIVEPVSYVTMGGGRWVKVDVYGLQGQILELDFYVIVKPEGMQLWEVYGILATLF